MIFNRSLKYSANPTDMNAILMTYKNPKLKALHKII